MAAELKSLALCPSCRAPLISTLAFRGAEWYCLECGSRLGFMDTASDNAPTPESIERYERLRGEWDEHAGGKLLAAPAYHRDCERCETRTEPHLAHATDEEKAEHERAMAWLRERAA